MDLSINVCFFWIYYSGERHARLTYNGTCQIAITPKTAIFTKIPFDVILGCANKLNKKTVWTDGLRSVSLAADLWLTSPVIILHSHLEWLKFTKWTTVGVNG